MQKLTGLSEQVRLPREVNRELHTKISAVFWMVSFELMSVYARSLQLFAACAP